jgi:CDP-diacylglycerol--glycerol-3-phosphate 3-phosphatidyltransferase
MPKSNSPIKVVQKKVDAVWKESLIKMLPDWVTPNLLSIIRLGLAPFIVIFLALGNYTAAITLFLIAALTDTLDGALARTRQQITELGLILDPLADKLLIVMICFYLLLVYPYKIMVLSIIIFELAIMIIAAVKISQKNPTEQAIKKSNFWGKSKMLTQILGIVTACLWLACPVTWLLFLSAGLIWISLVLQIKSAISYI